MPNTRRRRFSVQTSITNSNNNIRVSGGSQTSDYSTDIHGESRQMPLFISPLKFSRIRSTLSPINSKIISPMEILTESDSEVTVANSKQELINRVDKNVTASSSNIDLFNMLNATEVSPPQPHVKKMDVTDNNVNEKHVPRPSSRDTTPAKRERYPRQHRIKVRSPKRKQPNANDSLKLPEINQVTVGTSTVVAIINVPPKLEIVKHESPSPDTIITVKDASPDPCIEENTCTEIVESSDHSLDEMCRICHGGETMVPEFGPMISACACRGTVGMVHVKCLERWLTESGKSRCELCGVRYTTRRVHRYGVPRALVMWLLSQNAKQLMVDSLGIILMSPLAVLAAWLSGKTLAGLITKDFEVAPWPLASTFVLACMTLVCYYCWIVSAVTRHALGWWIWYRSQYEVRLQTPDNE